MSATIGQPVSDPTVPTRELDLPITAHMSSIANEQSGALTGPVPPYHSSVPWASALADQLRRALGLEVTAPPLGPGQPADGPAIVTRTLFSPSPREPMTGLPGYAAPAFTDLLVETRCYATYR